MEFNVTQMPLINKIIAPSTDTIDDKFVYFMAFLYSISTGEVESVD